MVRRKSTQQNSVFAVLIHDAFKFLNFVLGVFYLRWKQVVVFLGSVNTLG